MIDVDIVKTDNFNMKSGLALTAYSTWNYDDATMGDDSYYEASNMTDPINQGGLRLLAGTADIGTIAIINNDDSVTYTLEPILIVGNGASTCVKLYRRHNVVFFVKTSDGWRHVGKPN